MKQHVKEPTHVRGHLLDVVITQNSENTVAMVEIADPVYRTDSVRYDVIIWQLFSKLKPLDLLL